MVTLKARKLDFTQVNKLHSIKNKIKVNLYEQEV